MIKYIRFIILSIFITLSGFAFADDAALLPNAVQQFFDNNGNPLTSGSVTTYEPGTSTLKTTWKDGNKAVANTNPIRLDGGGKAIIYGDGSYRQVVKDKNNNLIWDAVTAPGGGSIDPTAGGDGQLVGTIKPWAGLIAPAQYAFSYGQELSRSTYSVLFTAITQSLNVICSASSNTISGISDTSQINIGSPVELICVPSGTNVVSKTSSTVVLSNPANVSITAVAKFFPFGNGNGTTTFNVPDLRGYVMAGRDNMGGTAASRLTPTYYGANDPDALGASGGLQSKTLLTANLPAYTPTGTINTLNFTFNSAESAAGSGATRVSNVQASGGTTTVTLAASTFTGAAQGGSSTPISLVQPTITLNYVIKITPDVNLSTASGVLSLGGMTGVLACGTGILCTGNIVSFDPSTILSIPASSVIFTQNGIGFNPTTVQFELSQMLKVTQAGAVAGGSASVNQTAFDNTLAEASASGKSAYVPKGTYDLTKITIPTGGTLICENPQNTVLKTNSTTEDVIISGVGGYGSISGCQIQSSVVRTDGWYINILSGNFTLDNFILNGPNQGVLVADSTSGVTVKNGLILNETETTGVGLKIGTGTAPGPLALYINNLIFSNDPAHRPFAHVLVQNLGDLTMYAVQMLQGNSNMLISPGNGQLVPFIKCSLCWMDSGVNGLAVLPAGTGIVRDITFDTSWFGNNTNADIAIVGGGSTDIDGISFLNPTILNAPYGLSADGSTIKNIRVLGGYSSNHSTIALNLNNIGSAQIDSLKIGAYAGNAANNSGIVISGTSDNIYFNNVNALGNSINYTNSSSGTNIHNNQSPGITGLLNLALNSTLTTSGAHNLIFVMGADATSTVPSGTHTLIGQDTTDTLTNKTISGSSNTISNVPAGTLTGTTLASNVVTSSLTSVGTLTSLTSSGVINTTNAGGYQITGVSIISTVGAGSYTSIKDPMGASHITIGAGDPSTYMDNGSFVVRSANAVTTFTSTTSLGFNLVTGVYKIGGTSGVSCTVGTLNPVTAIVISGIITHC